MLMIAGADEYLASLVVQEVVRRAPAERVAGTMREPERDHRLARLGVEVRRGDYEDPASMAQAFRGVDRLVLMPAGSARGGGTSAALMPVVDAAIAAGVQHIIHPRAPVTTGMGATPASHAQIAEAIEKAGASSTMLKTAIDAEFMANEARYALDVVGELVAPAGDAVVAPVLRADLAVAIATVLLEPAAHKGKTLELTAPDTISWRDLAHLASDWSGRLIAYRAVTEAEAEQRLRALIPIEQQRVILGMYQAFRSGWSATPSGDFERLTGRPATPARDAVTAVLNRTAF